MDDDVVQSLLDRQAITDVLHRYATALDGRDWDLLATCFLPDATARYEGLDTDVVGFDAIEELCRWALTSMDATQHLIGNVEVSLDGDTATTRCYLQAQHVRRGLPGGETFIIAGTYTDQLIRTPSGWRIRHRHLATTWTGGNPAVRNRPER